MVVSIGNKSEMSGYATLYGDTRRLFGIEGCIQDEGV